MTLNLDELERISKAATQPAPWKAVDDGNGRWLVLDANEFWVADCGEAPDDARAIAAEHNAMPQLLAGDHLACMRQRNALDEASPVMMTVLAMLADEASIEELRAIALLYLEHHPDHIEVWLDAERRRRERPRMPEVRHG